MDTELRDMVEGVALPLELIAIGALTATEPTDCDTWGFPGEPVTLYDWMEAKALEVYATGRLTPGDEWVVTDWTVVTAIGGPDIRVTVSLIGGGARVDGVFGGDTATVWLTSDAAAGLEMLAEVGS